jgi:[calcium/calmodulin-dependent protein kinase] kinase
MAATKPGQVVVDNPSDPRILDDSELSKRAGTPAFLAPEVNHEYKRETSSPQAKSEGPLNLLESQYWHRSTSTVQLPFSRPPVTKSIDVWAFGITLYCLLFGRVPFLHSNMFKTFDLIANSDWGVDVTMGFDRVPTHGRPPPAGDESEGAVVMRILDKMLQKDARDRMTLDEFKVGVSCQGGSVISDGPIHT